MVQSLRAQSDFTIEQKIQSWQKERAHTFLAVQVARYVHRRVRLMCAMLQQLINNPGKLLARLSAHGMAQMPDESGKVNNVLDMIHRGEVLSSDFER